MKTLNDYIVEGLTAIQAPKFGRIIYDMFKNGANTLSADQIKNLVAALDPEIIKELNKYFTNKDKENYIAYQVDNDKFIDWATNGNDIIKSISDYIYKNISKK